MSSQPVDLANDDLGTQLTALGEQLAWTPTPELRFESAVSSFPPVPVRLEHWRRWLAAAVLAFVLTAALLASSSSLRDAVADVLGIDGLRIEFGEPDITPTGLQNLGTPTSQQDLTRWLPFMPMQPATLGEPDAVYLRVLVNGDTLGIMAWEPTQSLPRASETGLGALLMQFDPPAEPVMMLKSVGLSTGTVTETRIDGVRAYWVEGASELTIFGARSTETRPTANALIWQQDGVGFRLESALTMDEAIAIAESLEPLSDPDLS